MGEQVFALRDGGQVVLGAVEIVVASRSTQRRESYHAIRATRPGVYGLPNHIYYVTCQTDTFPLDLEFPDLATRDRFLEELRAYLT